MFDSRGCLLLVRRDDFRSSEFTTYEMMKGSSVWLVRYHVDTDDFMTSLPKGWSIRSTVWSIVLGEWEDDSFLVINLSGKVVEYNLISKNLRDMYDMGSNQVTDNYHDGFIPPFTMYDMRAKHVDHRVQLVMEELRTESGMLIHVKQGRLSATTATENGVALDEEQLLFLAGGQDNAVDEDVDEQPVQDLALNVDNVFQADDCDAFDSDVDEAPIAQTMFMANLSSADPVYDKVDAVCDLHDGHEMHGDVQPNHVVDSHAVYTSDSNMTPYDQYVKDNAVPVVQNNASMVPNDAYEPLNCIKDGQFELTEREQKIDEHLMIVICDRNLKEENLKKELHSVKLQLASTIQHNKLMVDEVTSLKKDFNQKENKYLEEFLDLKLVKIRTRICIPTRPVYSKHSHDV
ncbi:hypothetical protein Tco_0030956 [Tanacetum coccineum]